jgi:hypothetical protein
MLMPVSRKPATDLGILAHQFFSAIVIAEVSGRHAMEKARSLLTQLGRRDRIAEPEAEEYEKAERTEPLHKISARDSGSPYRGAAINVAVIIVWFFELQIDERR